MYDPTRKLHAPKLFGAAIVGTLWGVCGWLLVPSAKWPFAFMGFCIGFLALYAVFVLDLVLSEIVRSNEIQRHILTELELHRLNPEEKRLVHEVLHEADRAAGVELVE